VLLNRETDQLAFEFVPADKQASPPNSRKKPKQEVQPNDGE